MKKVILAWLLLAILISAISIKGADKKQSDKDRITQLEAQLELIRSDIYHIHQEDIGKMYARTDDLNERLIRLEKGMRASQ